MFSAICEKEIIYKFSKRLENIEIFLSYKVSSERFPSGNVPRESVPCKWSMVGWFYGEVCTAGRYEVRPIFDDLSTPSGVYLAFGDGICK